MTKCYLFVILFVVSFGASAQIKKQSTLLGGQLFYSNNKNQVEDLNQKIRKRDYQRFNRQGH